MERSALSCPLRGPTRPCSLTPTAVCARSTVDGVTRLLSSSRMRSMSLRSKTHRGAAAAALPPLPRLPRHLQLLPPRHRRRLLPPPPRRHLFQRAPPAPAGLASPHAKALAAQKGVSPDCAGTGSRRPTIAADARGGGTRRRRCSPRRPRPVRVSPRWPPAARPSSTFPTPTSRR